MKYGDAVGPAGFHQRPQIHGSLSLQYPSAQCGGGEVGGQWRHGAQVGQDERDGIAGGDQSRSDVRALGSALGSLQPNVVGIGEAQRFQRVRDVRQRQTEALRHAQLDLHARRGILRERVFPPVRQHHPAHKRLVIANAFEATEQGGNQWRDRRHGVGFGVRESVYSFGVRKLTTELWLTSLKFPARNKITAPG